MQPTYFASFLVGETPENAPPIDDCVEEVARWIFANPRRPIMRPKDWPELKGEKVSFENGECVQLLHLHREKDGPLTTAAIRFEHPDNEGRQWRTDCVITQVDSTSLRFTITVSAGSSGDTFSPVPPPRTRPRIVKQIIDQFGARERFPLKTTFIRLTIDEIEQFTAFLLSPERTLPLVLVSRKNRSGHLLCKPQELADKLAGIAYVCVADQSVFSKNLSEHIDNRLNAYDGTVRIYWPRMSINDPPFRHRWWTGEQISYLNQKNRTLGAEILSLVAAASITRHVSGATHWNDVEREIAQGELQKLEKDDGKAVVAEDWLRQYETDLKALEAEKAEKATLAEELRVRQEELRQWKQLYLQTLRGNRTTEQQQPDDTEVIEDTEAAIRAAAIDFKEQLVFLDGRVEKSANEFEEPELLYAAFRWIATTYYDAKTGAKRCSDFEKSCREACQFRYSGHQSEVTMGRFSSDYEVSYGGKNMKLKEHVGFGTSTEPRHTIRVAFFFDQVGKKVVIGFIGQHQATRKSN